MAFTRVKAIAVNKPATFVKIAAVANVTAVPRNSTSYFCNYKLDQDSEVAYFDAPEDAVFTTSDYVVLNSDSNNGFMQGADFDATYVAMGDDIFSGLTSLTVNTGGTASDTLAAMTVTEPANLAAVAVQLVIIQNSIKSLAAKVNEVLAVD
jgi:hypothetical protein